ncbi:flippase [Vibrio breoganii]
MTVTLKKLLHKATSSIVFRNFSWYFVEKIVFLITTFLSTFVIARYFGPEKFGLFNYVLSIVSVFFALSTFGIDNYLVKLIKGESSRSGINAIHSSISRIRLYLSIFVVTLFLLYFLFERDQVSFLCLLFSLKSIFTSLNSIEQEALVREKISSIVKIKCSIYTLGLILKIIVAVLNVDIIYLILVIVFESSLICLCYFVFLGKLSIQISTNDLKTMRRIFIEGLPLCLSSALMVLYMRIDQIMIAQMMSKTDLGFYSAAVRLSEGWYFFLYIIAQSYLPVLIDKKRSGIVEYSLSIRKIITTQLGFAIFTVGVLYVLSPLIVSFAFGDAYLDSISVMRLHLFSGLCVAIGTVTGKLLVIENLQRFSLFHATTGVALNCSLNFVLIPIYGINGAALATICSQLWASTISYFVFAQTRQIFTKYIFGIKVKV